MFKGEGLIMKKVLAILAILASPVYGQSLPDSNGSLALQLPGAPSTYAQDSFRANQLDCSNAIGSATTMEFGVMGIVNQGNYYDYLNEYINRPFSDVGVYARIVIPLGQKPRNRIDCNALFELELRYRALEIMKLEAEINALRALQYQTDNVGLEFRE